MNKHLRNALKTAFEPPAPERKRDFCKTLPAPRAGRADFILAQAGYIRGRFWTLSALVATGMLLAVQVCGEASAAMGLLSCALPLLSLLGVTELAKSASYRMAELEMSCRHNLQEVTLIRLVLIGGVHCAILLAALLGFSRRTGMEVWRAGLYLCAPFLLCACLTLFLCNRLRTREVLPVLAGVTGFVCAGMGALSAEYQRFYAPHAAGVWAVACAALAALLFLEIRNLLKRTEELSWSWSLTA